MRFIFVLLLFASLFFIACKSSDKKSQQATSEQSIEPPPVDTGYVNVPGDADQQVKTEPVTDDNKGETDDADESSDVIESRIDGNFEGFDDGKVFKLINGQVWQQDEYKYSYSYKYRPSVTIVKSGYSYKMLVEGMKEAVKVKLIKGNNGPSKSPEDYTSDVVESYISNDFSGFNHGNIYQLDNGQIWEQTEYYTYSYSYSRPRVMIYKSGGSYNLKFENISEAVTVRRIK